MTAYKEQGTVFPCRGNRLIGIAALPEKPQKVGVLILVGGPQYRVGSHRQFTLLARSLAESGIPSFRFDYTGMGDSEGDKQEFNDVRQDITVALDRFQEMAPSVNSVVLWGLCDAASAALMYAHKESRVSGLVLLNPWVHVGDYSPEVKLSYYYASLFKAEGTWRRFFTGRIEVLSALREIAAGSVLLIKKILGKSFGVPLRHPFVTGMLEGFGHFKGDILIILSEQDLTAREFHSLASNEKDWKKLMSRPNVRVHEVLEADHTFSKQPWQDDVTRLTIEWASRSAPGD